MRSLSGVGLAVMLAIGWSCSEPQAPSLNGAAFLSATVDGRPWTPGPNPSDFYALLGPQRIILAARRPTEGVPGQESLVVEVATTDIFERRSYRLTSDFSGFASFEVRVLPPGDSLEVSFYGTTATHTGTLTIEAANTTDSVVVGGFTFEAVPLTGSPVVHRVAGQFRVRYTTTVP